MPSLTEKYVAYAKLLAQKYGYNLDIQYSNGSRCKAGGSKSIWIVSEKSLNGHSSGFREYDRVIHVWKETGYWGQTHQNYKDVSTNIKGDKSLWAIALHEFAHIMQEGKYEQKGYKRDVHGSHFQQLLKKLIIENPYHENFWVDEKEQSLSDAIAYFAQFV